MYIHDAHVQVFTNLIYCFLVCYDCNEEFFGDCPRCGPMDIVEDNPVSQNMFTCTKQCNLSARSL